MDPKHLCYDEWSGRFFQSNLFALDAVCNTINMMQLRDGDVTVNDFYELMEMLPIPPGYTHGWANGELMRIGTRGMISSDGTPAISVCFIPEPQHEAGSMARADLA